MITARGGWLEDLLGEYRAALAAGGPGRLPLTACAPAGDDQIRRLERPRLISA